MAGNFIDTNILVYAASGDPAKAGIAEDVIGKGGMVSVQVLNELANVLRRKARLTWRETGLFLATVQALLTVTPLTLEMHTTALLLAERYTLSIYDAMIVAAALLGDCDVLWSEDMQHDMVVEDRLRIMNPFFA